MAQMLISSTRARMPARLEQSLEQKRPRLEDVDYFGGCPSCWRNDGYLNIGRANWFICHKHRFRWLAGENLFSSWRFETNVDWQENASLIADYAEVDPVHPSQPRARSSDGAVRAMSLRCAVRLASFLLRALGIRHSL